MHILCIHGTEDDLTKAQSRNSALASQLSSLSPQLTSLETQLSTITTQLSHETQKRVAAENAAEEAEEAARRVEAANASAGTNKSDEGKKWKEEREDLLERLAFVEGEVEDYKVSPSCLLTYEVKTKLSLCMLDAVAVR
jgi:chromosome segregation ATPase